VGRVGWTLLEGDPAAKDAAGLLSELPFRMRLTLGASLLFGHYDDDARRRVLMHGFDAELELGGFRARVEYVARWFEVDQGPDLNGDGFYALLAYHHTFGVTFLEEGYVAFRYGRADPDRRIDDTLDVERYHLGLGWIPYEGFLVKLGVEYAEAPGLYATTVFLEVGYAF
jgi:hypothetical protein